MASLILIPDIASEPVRRVHVESLKDYQRLVGGNIESLRLSGNVFAFINEEGKLLGLPLNTRATRLAEPQLGGRDVIVGPCLIGSVDDQGETVDAPDGFERTIPLS